MRLAAEQWQIFDLEEKTTQEEWIHFSEIRRATFDSRASRRWLIVASRSALTEEGRTRIRNFSGRLNSYLVLWVLVSIAVVIACVWLRTRFGYLPLQRLYLTQYVKASVTSLVPRKRTSRYLLLLRVIEGSSNHLEVTLRCTDVEVIPERDESGRVKFDPKLGPFFRLKEGVPHKYFYWGTVSQPDAQMYLWLRDHIYAGHSLLGLYWICFLPFPVLIFSGMILSIKVDLRINREYEEGRLLRGIRLLNNSEYASESKKANGLGLPVFGSERSLG